MIVMHAWAVVLAKVAMLHSLCADLACLALCMSVQDNVALIAVLEMVEQQSGSKQLLCVANTHIHANPELNDVKLWQVHTLLKGLEKIANRWAVLSSVLLKLTQVLAAVHTASPSCWASMLTQVLVR